MTNGQSTIHRIAIPSCILRGCSQFLWGLMSEFWCYAVL